MCKANKQWGRTYPVILCLSVNRYTILARFGFQDRGENRPGGNVSLFIGMYHLNVYESTGQHVCVRRFEKASKSRTVPTNTESDTGQKPFTMERSSLNRVEPHKFFIAILS